MAHMAHWLSLPEVMYPLPFFGASDLLVLALFGLLALFFQFRPWLQQFIRTIAPKTSLCLVLLALLPIALRLALLPRHPAPTPDIYDEFSHLLVADTLLHFRLANPPHAVPQFFETFFVLQQPTYSSMYPLGQGSVLALGRLLFGHPWAGVLLCTAAFCALSYWMLRAWVTPAWALIGGILAIFQFGPLNEWTNCYWGGGVSAIAGCLAFGALPRIRDYRRKRDAACLGAGLALQILTRPFESALLLASILLFFPPLLWQRKNWRALIQPVWVTTLVVLPALGLTLLQNKQVTGSWTTLPYSLHQAQYGEPTSLSFQPIPVPQRPLTREQTQEYRAEAAFHGRGPETIKNFLLRLEYRVRYTRFFFLPPLYLALIAFAFTLRDSRLVWVVLAIALVVLGTNFFPYFFPRYIATVTCLFLLVSVAGLQRLARLQILGSASGYQAASLILFVCSASFTLWWSLHLTENPARPIGLLRYETWDVINHQNPQARIAVNEQLAKLPANRLIFVRYGPTHRFQDEWVYNAADIDHAPTVWARDLGREENRKLMDYYPSRQSWLLEPDANPPKLSPYETKPLSKPVFEDVK
jgi:hypothetical protein